MNLKRNKEGYMGGVGRRKGKGKLCNCIIDSKIILGRMYYVEKMYVSSTVS